MRTILRSAAFGAMLAGLLAPAAGVAQSLDTPIGLWKNIDDETKQPKALIRIVEQGGALVGRIEKILTDKADAVCEKCSDDRKGKPLVGMEILRAVRKTDGHDHWDGGTILDAAEGKVYKVRMTPADGGKKLDVRGYVGMPMLGRTQTWIRIE